MIKSSKDKKDVYELHGSSDFLAKGWQLMLRIPQIRPDEFIKGQVSTVRDVIPIRIKKFGISSPLTFSENGELVCDHKFLLQMASYIKSSEVQVIESCLLPSRRKMAILNVLAGEDCLDRNLSQIEAIPESGLEIVIKATIDTKKMGGRNIIRRADTRIIVSDEFYLFLKEMKIPAIDFMKLDVV
jgi:hypothetical protein